MKIRILDLPCNNKCFAYVRSNEIVSHDLLVKIIIHALFCRGEIKPFFIEIRFKILCFNTKIKYFVLILR